MGDMESMPQGIYQKTGPGETEIPGPKTSISRKSSGASQLQLPMESVLKRDLEKLGKMHQPEIVDYQFDPILDGLLC